MVVLRRALEVLVAGKRGLRRLLDAQGAEAALVLVSTLAILAAPQAEAVGAEAIEGRRVTQEMLETPAVQHLHPSHITVFLLPAGQVTQLLSVGVGL